jgi:pimeloyl-ACP methyl ester carboxylesterase
MQSRSSGSTPELAGLLSAHFTVYSYDRRGRGDSGDTQPYAVEREIEDLATVIDAAGGTAFLYGHSSGGCLALEAEVALGGHVRNLAMYEPPYNDDPAARQAWGEYIGQLTRDGRGPPGRRGSPVHGLYRDARRPDRRHAHGAVLAGPGRMNLDEVFGTHTS